MIDDVYSRIAADIHCYLGSSSSSSVADVASLCPEAVTQQTREKTDLINLDEVTINGESLENFHFALDSISKNQYQCEILVSDEHPHIRAALEVTEFCNRRLQLFGLPTMAICRLLLLVVGALSSSKNQNAMICPRER